MIIWKYIFARDSALKAKKKEIKTSKYPYRKKHFYPSQWDYQCIKIYNNYIELTKALKNENDKNIKQKRIKCYIKNIPDNIKQIELIYRNGLKLAIKYIDNKEYQQINSNNIAAIDLGEIHSITSIDNNGNAIIITGRKLRSIKRLRNKEMSAIRSKMSNCQKGSINYYRYRNALKNIKIKTDNQMNDSIHKITKLYVDYCLENNIKIVIYGDLDSVSRNTKKEKRVRRIIRQKLSQWDYGQIIKELQNKLNRHDIKMIMVKEYWTSQICPKCRMKHKPKGRNYDCKCGYHQHRDLVGAINILNDNSDYYLTRYNNLKYLQIA